MLRPEAGVATTLPSTVPGLIAEVAVANSVSIAGVSASCTVMTWLDGAAS